MPLNWLCSRCRYRDTRVQHSYSESNDAIWFNCMHGKLYAIFYRNTKCIMKSTKIYEAIHTKSLIKCAHKISFVDWRLLVVLISARLDVPRWNSIQNVICIDYNFQFVNVWKSHRIRWAASNTLMCKLIAVHLPAYVRRSSIHTHNTEYSVQCTIVHVHIAIHSNFEITFAI